jgi:hypothetical protein
MSRLFVMPVMKQKALPKHNVADDAGLEHFLGGG